MPRFRLAPCVVVYPSPRTATSMKSARVFRWASFLALSLVSGPLVRAQNAEDLWQVYQRAFRQAKYVDLTHTITPHIPVWKGFGPSKFGQTVNPETGQPYRYDKDDFVANAYQLSTDQLGTQLDPPAHGSPEYPSIDELPPTFAVRPLVVISIVAQVAKDPAYHLQLQDIKDWEAKHGPIPEGSVVFVRSDWSKRWPDPSLASNPVFPGVSLDALKFLHLERKILFHGHEPLDTDTTPNTVAETWLLTHGYTQAEAVTNLDQVPEKGALVAIGFPKFGGGTGGYARFIAICPPDWGYGVSIDPAQESPLPKQTRPLVWDDEAGMRVRK